jgi:RNA polymerase sigma-70 factor (ECF subfamily)
MTPAVAPSPAPSFREVYRANLGFVWRVVRHLGVPRADAEDVVQETFVVVLKKLGEFEGRSSLRTWIYGIAHRAVSEHRRRAHIRREIPTEAPDPGRVDAAQPELVERERARIQLAAILERLDGDKRAAFVFHEIEGMTMSEVAEIVGCPLQTAYSRLHAAREQVSAAARRLGAREVT